VSADYLFSGYFGRPDLTRERIKEGAYRTSDRGVLIDGELYVLGRLDDLLILNGRNFHAAEVEDAVSGIVGVKAGRNVAFSVYNPEHGTNELIIVCEVTDGADRQTIQKDVHTTIFEELGLHPGDIVLVEPGWLIKTTSGKIARGANADKYANFKMTEAR
jgi:acyl-CoA synthetase (AMP-forming)/AMP-acid ligase II